MEAKLSISSLVVSALALVTSVLTAWLTLVRRGAVKMTRPSQIHFALLPEPQILIRTLLYCTAKKGRVIEGMHVTLNKQETRQSFSIWVSGEKTLSRASGLYVGENGVIVSHYFMTPKDKHGHFGFAEGSYKLEVFAKLVDEDRSRSMWKHEFHISSEQSKALEAIPSGIYFDWGPEGSEYISHTAPMGPKDEYDRPIELLREMYKVISATKQPELTDTQHNGVAE